VWDGTDLKFIFRRTVSEHGMSMWYEICNIVESLTLNEGEDSLIWSFSSSSTFSVQSLYGVISFRGVKPVYPQTVWGMRIPPQVQVFLWLLSNNKLLTRDNLSKRRPVEDKTCVFCSENESIVHPFFECCVAKEVWALCANSLGITLNPGFESIAKILDLQEKTCYHKPVYIRTPFVFRGNAGETCEECSPKPAG
jgi:hypothetical protein